MEMQVKHTSDLRVARSAILNGVPIPPQTRARLEAQGFNVGMFEVRIRQQFETGNFTV